MNWRWARAFSGAVLVVAALAVVLWFAHLQSLDGARAACRAAHEGNSALVTAVGQALEAPPTDGHVRRAQEQEAIVLFVTHLQQAVDKDYGQCLATV